MIPLRILTKTIFFNLASVISYSVVLISCDGCELGLLENESLEVLRSRAVVLLPMVVDDMQPRLITVH